MKRKKVLCLVTAAVMALSLTGCGAGTQNTAAQGGSAEGTKTTESAAPAGSASEEKTGTGGETATIEVWSNNRHDEEYMNKMIEEFNASDLGVKINYTIMTDDWQNSIQLAYQANTAPDLISVSASDGLVLKDYVSAGMFESLTENIASDQEFQKVTEAYEHKYEGLNSIEDDIYWVPTGVRSGSRIEYNIELLKAAGYDAVPNTLEGMVEAAKAVTDNGGGSIYGVGFTQNGFGRWLEGIGEMSGYNHKGYDFVNGKYDFTEWKNMLETASQFYANGYVLPGSETQGVDNNRALFAQGSFALWGNASQEAGVFTDQFPCDFEWGVSELPTMTGEVKGALSCTPNFGWALLSSSKNKEAAWKVIQYFTGEEFLRGYFEGGYNAPLSSYMAGKIDASKAGRLADFALQDYEDVYPTVPSVTVEGDDFAMTMWNVILGNLNAEEAVADLNERYNAALESGIANGSCKRLTIENFDRLNPSAGTCVYGE